MHSRTLRRAGTGVLICALASGLLLILSSEAGAQPLADAEEPLSQKAAAAVSSYDSQKLKWQPCLSRAEIPGLPQGYYRLQCATMFAPLNWDVPQSGPPIRIRVSRLASTAEGEHDMLFTNPGGPGGEGVDLPLLMVSANRKKLMASQDIYGMDVRGTGGSSNLTCGGVQNPGIDPRVRSEANLTLMLDASALSAQACDVAGRDLRQYVTTRQTVHDVDLLRRIVGQEKVNWLGYSAGTWMGAHYATLFPERAGRMVFDSNVLFTRSWEDAFALQPRGFERRFESDFAPWVARHHSEYRLGATPEAVIRSYERLRAAMTPDTPVEDAVTLDNVIAGTMYAKAMFPDAAAALTELKGFLKAQGSGRFRTAQRRAAAVEQRVAAIGRDRLRPFSADANSAVFLAITCQDTPWSANRDSLITSSYEAGRQYPLIGWSTIIQPCAFWNRTGDAGLARPTGHGLPPVLMVQSEHDPATPIEGARTAAAEFAGARLLTVTGEGDHGLYAGGNKCVDKSVDSFVIDGRLPAEGTTCKGTAMPGADLHTMRATGLPVKATNPLLALRQISSLVGSFN
ncbi:alpha/beta fold hydrolase [Kineosporia sp. J2-2]|uniref:Alpha/beta fold hydrolase n=1 Tax=Kineosporia corallincola TaxID=2835133 RepID=A0ABS5TLR7_9ACTN|nr:alpha/beta hydrolase [Kineosporia corallincola]MBT0771314.1 alpha/beta fold hydrolase [Kineosporia corallincola]